VIAQVPTTRVRPRQPLRLDEGTARMLGVETMLVDLSDEELEKAVLGSVLLVSESFEPISRMLTTVDFFLVKHQFIWRGMTALHVKHQPVDYLLLISELKALDPQAFDDLGGIAYLTAVMNNKGAMGNHLLYAAQLKELSERRLAVCGALEIVQSALAKDTPTDRLADQFDKIVERYAPKRSSSMIRADTAVHIVMDQVELAQEGKLPQPIKTGIKRLDDAIGGWYPGQYSVIHANTGVGKSLLLYNFVWRAAQQGEPILFYSLEIPVERMMVKLIALQAGIKWRTIANGAMSSAEYERYLEASNWWYDQQLWIIDSPKATPRDIYTAARKFRETTKGTLIFIDYFQKLQLPSDVRLQKKNEELDWISSKLQLTAQENAVSIIMAAQSKPEYASKRKAGEQVPEEYGIAGTNSAAKDVDLNIALWRDRKFVNNAMTMRIWKNRFGEATPSIEFYYDDKTDRMHDGRRVTHSLAQSGHHLAAGEK
jgi:replicative DNA helicase